MYKWNFHHCLRRYMSEKKFYKGIKIYTFQGLDHLARKDIHNYLGEPIKQKNGRYYMTLKDYENGGRQFWKIQFQCSTRSLIRRINRRAAEWQNLVKQVLHRQRCVTLIRTLKKTSFERLITNSRLYVTASRSVQLRKTCPTCGSLNTHFDLGSCECHLCEDWGGCGRNTRCPDLIICGQCGKSNRSF